MTGCLAGRSFPPAGGLGFRVQPQGPQCLPTIQWTVSMGGVCAWQPASPSWVLPPSIICLNSSWGSTSTALGFQFLHRFTGQVLFTRVSCPGQGTHGCVTGPMSAILLCSSAYRTLTTSFPLGPRVIKTGHEGAGAVA